MKLSYILSKMQKSFNKLSISSKYFLFFRFVMNDRELRELREPQVTTRATRLVRARARATEDRGLSGVDKIFTQRVDFP